WRPRCRKCQMGRGGPNPFPALAPEGALRDLLAGRIARAAWRLERAERIEAELFEVHTSRNLGRALIRDGNSTKSFDMLLRYRGTALAEPWRARRLLKALQAEAAPQVTPKVRARIRSNPKPAQIRANPCLRRPPDQTQVPDRPDADETAGMRQAEQQRGISPVGCPGPTLRENPSEPEGRRNPGESVPVRAGGPDLALDHARRTPQIASGPGRQTERVAAAAGWLR
ncbi:MAG: hypothetical protein ACREJ0_14390, partial [Geminicoccaceae bacterium]